MEPASLRRLPKQVNSANQVAEHLPDIAELHTNWPRSPSFGGFTAACLRQRPLPCGLCCTTLVPPVYGFVPRRTMAPWTTRPMRDMPGLTARRRAPWTVMGYLESGGGGEILAKLAPRLTGATSAQRPDTFGRTWRSAAKLRQALAQSGAKYKAECSTHWSNSVDSRRTWRIRWIPCSSKLPSVRGCLRRRPPPSNLCPSRHNTHTHKFGCGPPQV